MAKLRNIILEKLAAEGKISHLSGEREMEIYSATKERMNNYNREYSKRMVASYISAGKLVFNS